jgi:hypothetical protein
MCIIAHFYVHDAMSEIQWSLVGTHPYSALKKINSSFLFAGKGLLFIYLIFIFNLIIFCIVHGVFISFS